MSDDPTYERPLPALESLYGTCPGGLAWDCCHADDRGVDGAGHGCEFDRPWPS